MKAPTEAKAFGFWSPPGAVDPPLDGPDQRGGGREGSALTDRSLQVSFGITDRVLPHTRLASLTKHKWEGPIPNESHFINDGALQDDQNFSLQPRVTVDVLRVRALRRRWQRRALCFSQGRNARRMQCEAGVRADPRDASSVDQASLHHARPLDARQAARRDATDLARALRTSRRRRSASQTPSIRTLWRRRPIRPRSRRARHVLRPSWILDAACVLRPVRVAFRASRCVSHFLLDATSIASLFQPKRYCLFHKWLCRALRSCAS